MVDCTRLFGKWGQFTFEWVRTLPVGEWGRDRKYRLSPQPNIGYDQSYHWLGKGTERVSMRGKIFGASNIGDQGSIEDLFAQGDTGVAYLLQLIGPGGRVKQLGLYFLENYRDVRSELLGHQAMQIDFDLAFVRQPE